MNLVDTWLNSTCLTSAWPVHCSWVNLLGDSPIGSKMLLVIVLWWRRCLSSRLMMASFCVARVLVEPRSTWQQLVKLAQHPKCNGKQKSMIPQKSRPVTLRQSHVNGRRGRTLKPCASMRPSSWADWKLRIENNLYENTSVMPSGTSNRRARKQLVGTLVVFPSDCRCRYFINCLWKRWYQVESFAKIHNELIPVQRISAQWPPSSVTNAPV